LSLSLAAGLQLCEIPPLQRQGGVNHVRVVQQDTIQGCGGRPMTLRDYSGIHWLIARQPLPWTVGKLYPWLHTDATYTPEQVRSYNIPGRMKSWGPCLTSLPWRHTARGNKEWVTEQRSRTRDQIPGPLLRLILHGMRLDMSQAARRQAADACTMTCHPAEGWAAI
jgi:hypothetical protein